VQVQAQAPIDPDGGAVDTPIDPMEVANTTPDLVGFFTPSDNDEEASMADAAAKAASGPSERMCRFVRDGLMQIVATGAEKKAAAKHRNESHLACLARHGAARSNKNLAKLGAINRVLHNQANQGKCLVTPEMAVLWLLFRGVNDPNPLSDFDGDYGDIEEHLDHLDRIVRSLTRQSKWAPMVRR